MLYLKRKSDNQIFQIRIYLNDCNEDPVCMVLCNGLGKTMIQMPNDDYELIIKTKTH